MSSLLPVLKIEARLVVGVVVALEFLQHGAEVLRVQANPQRNPAFFAIENMRMFGEVQVVLERGESPKPMQRDVTVIPQQVCQHPSLSAEHSAWWNV